MLSLPHMVWRAHDGKLQEICTPGKRPTWNLMARTRLEDYCPLQPSGFQVPYWEPENEPLGRLSFIVLYNLYNPVNFPGCTYHDPSEAFASVTPFHFRLVKALPARWNGNPSLAIG